MFYSNAQFVGKGGFIFNPVLSRDVPFKRWLTTKLITSLKEKYTLANLTVSSA